MAKYTKGEHRAAIAWDDCLHTMALLEEEHRVSLYLHLWPHSPGRNNHRWLVRVDAVPIGSPYRAKHLCSHHEYWPNGRQLTLSACVMRCLLEISALLDEVKDAR